MQLILSIDWLKAQFNLLVAMPLQKLSDAAKQIAPKESRGCISASDLSF